jgi:hypothetical protein
MQNYTIKEWLTVQKAPLLLDAILFYLDNNQPVQLNMAGCTSDDMDWIDYVLGPLYGTFTSAELNELIHVNWNGITHEQEVKTRYAAALKSAREAFQLARYFGCTLSFLPPKIVQPRGRPLRPVARNRSSLAPNNQTPELSAPRV